MKIFQLVGQIVSLIWLIYLTIYWVKDQIRKDKEEKNPILDSFIYEEKH